ncbi:MAG: hypothetical protein RBG13Loki_3787 [Promethearchaeota archaeon CR_4]|nr:MAG: hypothetical protein RBG13Loki_3787 [Candidatus Lokiarchaeota archaeon CR_4]
MNKNYKVILSLACFVAGCSVLLVLQSFSVFSVIPGGNTGGNVDTDPITNISLTVNYGNGTTRTWTTITLTGTTTADRSVYAATAQKCSMSYDDYGGGAYFITGIDGQLQNSTHFWQYYVNGKYASVGACAYVLHSQDTIYWNFTTNYYG